MEIKCPECNYILQLNEHELMINIGGEYTCPDCNCILELNEDMGEYYFEVVC